MKKGLALMLVATAAYADLYRWVDPQSGSVKFSSVPPPAAQSGVDVVPYRGRAAPPKPVPSSAGALELRWRELLDSPDLLQRMPELVAATSELEKLDPAGAPRRRAEAESVLQRLLKVEK